MKTLARIGVGPGTVLGLAALVVAASGVALAAPGGGQGELSACVHRSGGGFYKARKCATGDRRLTWSVRGPAGPPGATGAAGATGRAGPQGVPGSARAWAFVRADGVIASSGGRLAISAVHKKVGEYCLGFTPDLPTHTLLPLLATIQGADFTADLISVNTSVGSDCNAEGGIGVFTMDKTGAPTDQHFLVALL
jgi:hypothetical protein